jgi:S-DNA-T family DNA segregation ATPase FtsK/SpoIIIE
MVRLTRARGAAAVPRRRVALRLPRELISRLVYAPLALAGLLLVADLASYHAGDASFDTSAGGPAANLLGVPGADIADLALQFIGLGAWIVALIVTAAGVHGLVRHRGAEARSAARRRPLLRIVAAALSIVALAAALAAPTPPLSWPLSAGLGGMAGDTLLSLIMQPLALVTADKARWLAGGLCAVVGFLSVGFTLDVLRARSPRAPLKDDAIGAEGDRGSERARVGPADPTPAKGRPEPTPAVEASVPPSDVIDVGAASLAIKTPKPSVRASDREQREIQPTLPFAEPGFRLPELIMLTKPKPRASAIDEEALRQNAQLLENVLAEFGVRGQIDHIRPGPVVTLYELAPAPGVKSARVVALSDDIARSMSVAACRVSVVSGRNAIGIELPNARRETVFLRDLLSSTEYEKASQTLPLALGETIGGDPYIVDLAKMPHLLIAGTTGSGKSVGVNAMILSILYRLPPDKCKFIMIDPKMLELSVYDGIPHLLAPVVTEPKKAIVALKWTVREMEDRYRRMSKIGVRNVAGYNERANEALARGEHFVRTVQTGFNEQGRPIFEEEKLRPEPMPYLVVVIDEVADLMMVAGKDIEGAVQRLAQMARAAGIHLIMATQRPSVDVITGTIKANFPTRISFQVTSKIDSRTIMGEQGAEQLLGMGDMLYMAGGGRITRLHGPYVDDDEVFKVAKFLRDQGEPQYLDDVTALPEGDDEDSPAPGDDAASADLYDQAVAVVTRDRKASTSYIQRRLQIGYNRAASLIERMEKEGVVGIANHAGKREILAGPPP